MPCQTNARSEGRARAGLRRVLSLLTTKDRAALCHDNRHKSNRHQPEEQCISSSPSFQWHAKKKLGEKGLKSHRHFMFFLPGINKCGNVLLEYHVEDLTCHSACGWPWPCLFLSDYTHKYHSSVIIRLSYYPY